jgi:hypothetical protein
VGAILATCALLAVVSLKKPQPILVLEEPDSVPETKFDEVTIVGGANGGWYHRWTAEASSGERAVPGLTLSAPSDDDSEPPEAARLSRRLDAVRLRQSKGAVLTGKIDAVNTSGRQRSNAPLRPPAHVQPTRTADSRSGSLHSTPESVFR